MVSLANEYDDHKCSSALLRIGWCTESTDCVIAWKPFDFSFSELAIFYPNLAIRNERPAQFFVNLYAKLSGIEI